MDVYTDGACSGNPGPGGWSCVRVMSNGTCDVTCGGDRSTTNNRMELTAAVNGCMAIAAMGSGKCTVYSDSAYVINAMQNGWIGRWQRNGWQASTGKPVKNVDLWQKLIRAIGIANANGAIIEFAKVKGHAGNRYNEMADKCAVAEARKYSV